MTAHRTRDVTSQRALFTHWSDLQNDDRVLRPMCLFSASSSEEDLALVKCGSKKKDYEIFKVELISFAIWK